MLIIFIYHAQEGIDAGALATALVLLQHVFIFLTNMAYIRG